MNDDGLGIPPALTISGGAREAGWGRYQPPPPPRIAPREVEVARAAEKKRRAYERIAKMKAKKNAAAAVVAVTAATATVTRIPAGIVADERWPNMYRVKVGRGQLSEMLSLTRAKDALAHLRGRRP
jgi:hypothetical protein